jgi:hypothetical protein
MAGSAADPRFEKEAGKEKIISRSGAVCVAALLMAVLLCAGAVFAADDLDALQRRFDAEQDGVRKAKILQKLGDAQFAKERAAARANDYSAVGLVMEKYRDNVRAAVDALKKQRPDAEKHSSGYRQLEIHVAVGIREVRDVILAMPEPLRPPMQLVESDLKAMDKELLRLLFPRRPGERSAAPPGAAAPKSDKPPEATEKQP